MGDFNETPALMDSWLKDNFNNVRRIVSTTPTRRNNVIDYICYRDIKGNINLNVKSEVCLSDHKPVMATWKLPSKVAVEYSTVDRVRSLTLLS
ncbi:hypothetical protein HERIO_765 [Hepatospora eriocheir]|uniref:Endonuclease/exonuclease/phosphatase domain-containing protein n=1 Tax=Hepatospora eriocheir TaxID=1081669 RepID=A0A1X0QCA2_9MICR|nr:hypothetical protein HERIO_765 [Hepatospora eriocheir]